MKDQIKVTWECAGCKNHTIVQLNRDEATRVNCKHCGCSTKLVYEGKPSQVGSFIKRTELDHTGGGYNNPG